MVTVFRLDKTLGDMWTHLNITTPVSWLLLAKHYIKANTIGTVVATTLNFEIQRRLKCKTYRIDKEKTGITILKSFSYK